jgi:hypothetical protein
MTTLPIRHCRLEIGRPVTRLRQAPHDHVDTMIVNRPTSN